MQSFASSSVGMQSRCSCSQAWPAGMGRSHFRNMMKVSAGHNGRRSPAHHSSAGVRQLTVCEAKPNPLEDKMAGPLNISLRSEAEAPYRSLRLVMFGFFAVSASIGGVIALSQLIAALAHAPGALPLEQVAESLGIDLGAVAVFVWLVRRDLAARDKQMTRLLREEKLGILQIELANKKTLKLSQLRSFSRVVLAAGTPQQVAEAVEAAQPYKEQLAERGVLLIPLPIYAAEDGAPVPESMPLTAEDLRWRAKPLRLNGWADWFDEQLSVSNAKSQRGLYVSLRLDGRVRASGTGIPPYERLVAELAPMDGMWKGLGDGFDGAV